MIDFEGLAVPTSFISALIQLDLAEIFYGYRHSWIDDIAVIEISLHQYSDGQHDDAWIERLALLLKAESSQVAAISDEWREMNPSSDSSSRAWLYVFLSWLYKSDNSSHSFSIVDEIYAGFDYPESIEGFVSYMPVPDGQSPGLSEMETRWQDFLSSEKAYFDSRSSLPRGSAPPAD